MRFPASAATRIRMCFQIGPRDEAGPARERSRWTGEQGSLRSGLRICRSGECDFRRALQPASACVFRSDRAMKPGLRENEAVGLVSKVLYDLGSEYVEAVNAISGERCNPHPHVF